jgi:uncharacterized protein
MVVDVHYHWMASWIQNKETARAIAGSLVAIVKRAGFEKTVEEVASAYFDSSNDLRGEKRLRQMEEIGIDASVVIVSDNIDLGTSEEDILQRNRAGAQLGREHPKRLIPFAGVDPRRERAPEILRRCIEEFGMRGLKWHPDNGYYPDSPKAYDLLKVLQGYKLPLLCHTGTSKTRSKFAHPSRLDDPSVDFPEVPIIAAHSGHFLWRDWCALAHYRENLFGDLAEWQCTAMKYYDRFCHELREAMDIAGAHTIMWATDAPFLDPFVPDAQWIQIIRDLPKKAPEGIHFTEEEVEAILGGNAQRVLSL